MSQLRAPVVRFNRSIFEINVAWLAAGLALAAASGWILAGATIDSPAMSHRVAGACLVPLALVLSLFTRELARSWVSPGDRTRVSHRLLYPAGSAPTGYFLAYSPSHEIREALAGPIASFLTAGVSLSTVLALPTESIAGRIFIGAGLLNLLLGGINLLPALPFDGGIVLRAIFWFLHDNYTSGTRVAFLYGQLIASGALGFGIFLLSFRSDLAILGLWFVVLGWLVVRSSRSELMRAHLLERSSQVRAADAVSGLNPTIRAAEGVAEALDILLEQKDNGPGLVRDRDRFVGTLTLDLIRQIPRAQWRELTVEQVMIPLSNLADTPPGSRLLDALQVQSDLQGASVVVRHPDGSVAGLINDTISPRVLLRRAEERGFDIARTGSKRENPSGS